MPVLRCAICRPRPEHVGGRADTRASMKRLDVVL